MIGNWQEQYRRMQRSYEKVNGEHHSTETYADDLYHFFMDCWHLKDWLRHDLTVPEELRTSIKKSAEADPALRVAADLANGVKHFKLAGRKRGGTEIVGNDVTIAIGARISVIARYRVKNDAGHEFVAEDIARQALEVWDEILTKYGLKDSI